MTLVISTNTTQIAQAARTLRLAGARLDGGPPPDAAAAILVQQLRQAAPLRSGRLRQSIVARPSGALIGFWSLYYGKLLADGTRPHTIQPRNGRFLVFRRGGSLVFARRVHHPGTPANDFPQRAAVAAGPALLAVLATQARQLAQAIEVTQ